MRFQKSLTIVASLVMLGASYSAVWAAPADSRPAPDTTVPTTASQCTEPITARTGIWSCLPTSKVVLRPTSSGARPNATPTIITPADVGGWGSCLSNVCVIVRTKYIADTYADGEYGQGATLIGKYRIQLHDNMNGRSTRQTTTFTNISGPEVEALHVTTDCREDVSLRPDNHCGYRDPLSISFSLLVPQCLVDCFKVTS